MLIIIWGTALVYVWSLLVTFDVLVCSTLLLVPDELIVAGKRPPREILDVFTFIFYVISFLIVGVIIYCYFFMFVFSGLPLELLCHLLLIFGSYT